MRTVTSNVASLTRGRRLSRRALLRGAGAAVALPALDCMVSASDDGDSEGSVPRRIVAINFELSFHPPNLMPTRAGRDYETTPYLEPLADLRDEFTIISGTSHPDVDGGHAASKSWLTGAPHPGAANFTNTISMDQVAARAVGLETRLAYMAVGGGGISVSANGVPVPASPYPSGLFRTLFIEGTEQEKKHQVVKLQDGQSVLDTVLDAARRMQQRASQQDRQKLDEYFTSVREAEQRLHKAEQWQHRPKPQVDTEPPVDVRDPNDIIARARQLYDVMYLALITDSTRVIAYGVGDSKCRRHAPGHLDELPRPVSPRPGSGKAQATRDHRSRTRETVRRIPLATEGVQ